MLFRSVSNGVSLNGTKPNAALESKVGELAEKLQNEIQSMCFVHFDENGTPDVERDKGKICHSSMFASMPSNGLGIMVCGYGIVFNFCLHLAPNSCFNKSGCIISQFHFLIINL